MKLPKNYKRLNLIINNAEKAMLDSMPVGIYDDEFHYVIARLQLKLSHVLCKALPLPEEEETSDKFSHILIEESGKPISGGIGELDSIPLPIIRLCESDSSLYINRGWNTNALSRCNECIMRVNK